LRKQDSLGYTPRIEIPGGTLKTPKFIFRRATKKDKPAIEALIAQYPQELEQMRLPSFRDFVVCECNGVIVACAAA